MNLIKTTIRAVVFTAAIMFGGVVGWQFVSPVPAPTNPARPSKIEPRDATVPIQQPLRCTGQLCLSIPAQPAQVSMNARGWNFKFSVNIAGHPFTDPFTHSPPSAEQKLPSMQSMVPSPLLPDGGWSLNFFLFRDLALILGRHSPTRTYWEITTASPVLIQGWYVKMSAKASPSPPGGNLDCRMYFQQVGDDLSGQGQYAYYRWLSTKPLIPTAKWFGNFVQVVGLEPEFWSTVTGEPGNWSNFVTGERGDASAAATAGFQRALANPQSIGIVCSAYVRGDPFAGDSFGGPHSFPFADQRIPRADQLFSMFSFAVCDPFADTNEACAPPSAQQR